MNYEDMSDFEVNKLVSNFIDLIFTFNDTDETVYICEKDGAWDMVPISYFDPCNNPSDAWPIIIDNKIDVSHCVGGWVSCSVFKTDERGMYREFYKSTNEKPLRAAIICFLKMKDAEK